MFFRAARKELEDWMPKVWPAAARIPSPVLAPPKEGAGAASVKTQPSAASTEAGSGPAHGSRAHRKKGRNAVPEKAGGGQSKVKTKP